MRPETAMKKREELNERLVGIEDELSLNAMRRTRRAETLLKLGRERRKLEQERADVASELRELTRDAKENHG